MATFAAVRVVATSAVREACNARAFDDRVRALAGDLFVALRTAHHLPTEHGERLAAAAMLREIGSFVNRGGRHRHTHYLIANSELSGYATAQRRIIAVIARYVGKSRPAPGDRLLRDLVAVGR